MKGSVVHKMGDNEAKTIPQIKKNGALGALEAALRAMWEPWRQLWALFWVVLRKTRLPGKRGTQPWEAFGTPWGGPGRPMDAP